MEPIAGTWCGDSPQIARCRVLSVTTAGGGAEFDLVIASDVLYDRAAVEPFFGVVAAALKPGGTLLVSHTDRGIVSMDEAIQRAQVEFGLSWTAEASGGEGGGLGESIACHTFEKDF